MIEPLKVNKQPSTPCPEHGLPSCILCAYVMSARDGSLWVEATGSEWGEAEQQCPVYCDVEGSAPWRCTKVIAHEGAHAFPHQQHDPVNHPSHYTEHPSGVECITITEHMNFNLGNAVKYVWRADGKGGIEDLRKAVWYLEREIGRLARGGVSS